MRISGTTRLIAHIGFPTDSFKAPLIYNPYLAAHGFDAVVVPMGCKPDAFAAPARVPSQKDPTMISQVTPSRALWAILALLASHTDAAAQSPRTIRVVYAFAAGGSGDGLARLIADRLGSTLGVAAIVENRAGASGRIGTRSVVNAEPDGATLLLSAMGPVSLHPVVYSNLDFDPIKDLAPIAQLATFDIALVAGSSISATSLRELVTLVGSDPEKASYGTPGLGGLPHFFAVRFSSATNVQLRNVPYRGAAAVTNDLVSGQLPIAFVPAAENVELHKSGRTRILATSGAVRSPFLPAVPTFKEQGVDLQGEGWYALYAPARTPQALLDRLSETAQRAMRDPALRERISALGLVPTGTSPGALDRIQKADRELWSPAIRASGFKASD